MNKYEEIRDHQKQEYDNDYPDDFPVLDLIDFNKPWVKGNCMLVSGRAFKARHGLAEPTKLELQQLEAWAKRTGGTPYAQTKDGKHV